MISPAQQTPMINPNAPPAGLTVLIVVTSYLCELILNPGRVQQKFNAHMNAMISQLQHIRRRVVDAMQNICEDNYGDGSDDDDGKGGGPRAGKKRRYKGTDTGDGSICAQCRYMSVDSADPRAS